MGIYEDEITPPQSQAAAEITAQNPIILLLVKLAVFIVCKQELFLLCVNKKYLYCVYKMTSFIVFVGNSVQFYNSARARIIAVNHIWH